jgi:hypothetical protein
MDYEFGVWKAWQDIKDFMSPKPDNKPPSKLKGAKFVAWIFFIKTLIWSLKRFEESRTTINRHGELISKKANYSKMVDIYRRCKAKDKK